LVLENRKAGLDRPLKVGGSFTLQKLLSSPQQPHSPIGAIVFGIQA